MSVDEAEAALFQAALDRSSTDVIRKRLEDDVIARAWKREMAEAELDRRENESSHRLASNTRRSNKRHLTASIQGWVLSLILVVCVGVGAVVFFLK